MSLYETVRFAIRGITANKLRSGLTVLGILIGVAAVILLVAVGNGSQRQIQQSIERLGTNTLTITGGAVRGQSTVATQNTSLTMNLVDALNATTITNNNGNRGGFPGGGFGGGGGGFGGGGGGGGNRGGGRGGGG